MKPRTIWLVLAAVAGAGLLALFNYFAPIQAPSLAVWTGVVSVLAGIVCLIKPARRAGAVVLLAGIALFAGGMAWPSPLLRVVNAQSKLDEIFPEYQYYEKHAQRIHASPDRVAAAIEQTTFDDIRVYYTLVRIRAMVMGRRLRREDVEKPAPTRVLAFMRDPASGFVPLYQNSREIVMGMVGYARPYTQRPDVHELTSFQAFREPDSVRVAFNLLITDDGGGWSTITSETRILAIGDKASRATGRYWRLIYPGSGMIRRMWLNAIEAKATSD